MNKKPFHMNIQLGGEITRGMELDILNVISSAIQKQIPMAPELRSDGVYECPRCYEWATSEDKKERHLHCFCCGQRLDWREE